MFPPRLFLKIRHSSTKISVTHARDKAAGCVTTSRFFAGEFFRKLQCKFVSKFSTFIIIQIKKDNYKLFLLIYQHFLKKKMKRITKIVCLSKKSFPSFSYPVHASLYSSLFIVEIYLTSYFTVYLINKKSTIYYSRLLVY